MKQICPIEECTACYACANICHKEAISFKENEFGVQYPIIDEDLCINCKACAKVCPNNSMHAFKTPQTCYVAYRTDTTKRRRSASGGVANLFSEYIIENLKGSVWGVKTTANFEVVFTEFTDIMSLEKSKGSQYVHSHVHKEYNNLKNRLNEGKNVLYIGLPCQVAGLQNFLGKNYSNLITCDLICHGVLPGRYLQEEIAYLSKKNKAEVVGCSFRNNAGSNYYLVLYDSHGRSCYKKRAYLNPYFNFFLQSIALRPNCNKCKYARSERISDITLGDYIGLGKDAPFDEKSVNNCIVIINTERGKEFWQRVRDSKDVISFEREYNKAIQFQPSLIKPSAPHRNTKRFLTLYKKDGFVKASRKLLLFDIVF